MTKIWTKIKPIDINPFVESYTVGDDNLLDEKYFFGYDIDASIAHAGGLIDAGIYTPEEFYKVYEVLKEIKDEWLAGSIKVGVSDEDCHAVIERLLTERLGDLGKKIHTGRSRNDQALVMMRLFMVNTLEDDILTELATLRRYLSVISEKYRGQIFIGYTHTQQAMPTTLGHYFDSFFEQVNDDERYVKSVLKSIHQNPLGSGAGFGSTVDIDREWLTTQLKFKKLQKNSLYCQNSRGKFELKYIHAQSQIMLTLQKIATDMLMYTSQEFNFFTANDSITTGSSMMPQKKNLDIAEIIRAKHGMIVGIENQVQTISHGLISGYNRDMQLIKKCMVESYEITLSSIKATNHLLRNLTVNPDSIKNKINKTMFAADMATEYSTRKNIPFRDAYKEVMDEIEYSHIDEIDPMSFIKKRKTLGSPGNYY